MSIIDATSEKWASGALRILSETVGVDEISLALECKPTRFYAKGEPVSLSKPEILRSHSLWILESEVGQDQELAAHLLWLVAFVESRRDALQKLVPKCTADLFCGFASGSGQGGTMLDRKLIARLSGIALDLRVDLFPPGPITL